MRITLNSVGRFFEILRKWELGLATVPSGRDVSFNRDVS
jgi:hypothetical protein